MQSVPETTLSNASAQTRRRHDVLWTKVKRPSSALSGFSSG